MNRVKLHAEGIPPVGQSPPHAGNGFGGAGPQRGVSVVVVVGGLVVVVVVAAMHTQALVQKPQGPATKAPPGEPESHCSPGSTTPSLSQGLVAPVVVVTDGGLPTTSATRSSTRLSTLAASPVVKHGGRVSACAKAVVKR